MITIIQARMNSSRLPGKVMMPLYGKPMLYRLIERMKLTDYPFMVATAESEPNNLIMKSCKEWGVQCFKGYEQDVMSRLLLAADVKMHSNIIRVTGDNPLTSPDLLNLLAKIHLKYNNDYTFMDGPPSGTRCEVINVEALRLLRLVTHEEELQENMTPALKTMRKIMRVPCPVEWKSDLRLTVDTRKDMDRTRKIYELFEGEPPAKLGSLISCLMAYSESGRRQLSTK